MNDESGSKPAFRSTASTQNVIAPTDETDDVTEPKRYKKLSADLPQHWLHEDPYWSLSDAAWRLHTHALMYCIGRTNGAIGTTKLSLLLPGSDENRGDAVKELVAAKLWKQTPTGWQIQGWAHTQSTVKQIEKGKESARNRVAKSRAKAKSPADVTRYLTRDVTSDVTGVVRNGTERQDAAVSSDENGEDLALWDADALPSALD